ncbi:restriction endonuclease subunit S [Dermabacter vaginalis]|uniref:restriction endonuclease subunit S n=1 Tax=Dermabacter vaginalis TaxID=1630135 RepID=UPI0021A8C594|nr:restriction endonuclease subunit S [Dermabacter vaginalis]MCT2150815.1 restriction endonuclease subunit S [Dermabacter vaginalis]
MSTVRPYLNAVAQVPEETDNLVFSTGFAVLSPESEEITSRYLYWAMQSAPFIAEATRWSNGVSYPAINVDDLMRIKLPLPPRDQQVRIAQYLDVETAKIDHLIAKQRALTQLLDEHSKSATYQILKKSVYGAERLRLKWLLSKMQRPVLEGSEIVTAYDDGEVTLRSNRRLDGYWMSSDDSNYQGVKQGDFVFHGLDGYRGAVGLSDSDGKMTPACHVCSVSKTIRPDFLALYLRFLGGSGYLKNQSMTVRGDSMDFRNWQKVAALSVPVPSLIAQKEAVDQLTELKSREEEVVASSTRLINLLRERRSALITAAVTGQIEV